MHYPYIYTCNFSPLDAFAALPDVRVSGRPGEPRRHPLFDGRAKNEQCQDNKKRHHQHGNGVFTAILVYSIVPYLRQKVQENRYFTGILSVIHSFLHPVDNYYFSSWAGATAGAVAINL